MKGAEREREAEESERGASEAVAPGRIVSQRFAPGWQIAPSGEGICGAPLHALFLSLRAAAVAATRE